MTEASRIEELRANERFREFPEPMQRWFLSSPTAVEQFAEFFIDRGGRIQEFDRMGLPAYYDLPKPAIAVDKGMWQTLRDNPSDERMIDYFGAMSHEIGHMRSNTGNPVFAGDSEEAYVKYRSDIEANAIFNAFPIYKEVSESPGAGLPRPPMGAFGYLHSLEARQLYAEWSAGNATQEQTIAEVSARVSGTRYNRSDKPADLDGDGEVTHRDKFIEDYRTRYLPDIQRRREAERPRQSDDVQPPSSQSKEGMSSFQAPGPGEPNFEALHRVRTAARSTGQWSEEQCTNIAAAGLAAFKGDAVCKELHQVVVGRPNERGESNIFLMYSPHGEQGPHHHVHVGGESRDLPAQQSLQQVAELDRQQTQTQLHEQQAPTRNFQRPD